MIMDEIKDYPPYLDYPKPYKVQTNADRIRSMSDEELARWLDNFFWGHKKVNLFDILKWLKQPAEG